VFVSATVELKLTVITPFPSVAPVADGEKTFPLPVAVSCTTSPLTGFPNASVTVTVMVDALEPVLAVIAPGAAATVDRPSLGGPTVPVAVNVTGLPVSPLAVAVSVFVPAVGLRVHEVSVAIPSAPVLTDVVGVTAPLPAAGVNVTSTFATGFPLASFTSAERRVGSDRRARPAGPQRVPAVVAAAPAV